MPKKKNAKSNKKLNKEELNDDELDEILSQAIEKQEKTNRKIKKILDQSYKSQRSVQMTFRELREQERIVEASRNAPGAYDGHLVPFGQDKKQKMTMGGKYKFQTNDNPAPGQYDVDSALSQVKPTARSAVIKDPVSPYRRPKERVPEPGQYDNHLKPFAADINQSMTLGGKYKWKPNDNPAPGQYDTDRAQSMTMFQSRSTVIREPTYSYRRPKETAPDPGQYDKHLTPFASGMKSNATMGSKYVFKPDQNPAVGQYELDESFRKTQRTVRSAVIREDTITYRRPKEGSPDPGQYDRHLTPFGQGSKTFIIGQKLPEEYNLNPGPGQYNPEDSIMLTKDRARSAVIREETSPYRRPKEQTPEPGSYDGHLKPFGSGMAANATMGSKYVFKPDSNPPVGAYELDESFTRTQRTTRSAVIKEETSPYRRPKEQTPEPGSYDKHLTPFGSGMKANATMGSKYVFKANDNPAPGQYEVEEADKSRRNRSPETTIREPTMITVGLPDNYPSPGQYDQHLQPFGSGAKSASMMGKDEKKISQSPGPGDFDTDTSLNLTKPKIAGGPYISERDDFEERNNSTYISPSKINDSMNVTKSKIDGKRYSQQTMSSSNRFKSAFTNKYLLKNMSPDSRAKVMGNTMTAKKPKKQTL